MAARKKKVAKKPAHDDGGKDHGHVVVTITIGPLIHVKRKGGKANKATRMPKEVKAFLKWALKNS